jgi:MATE family multidrug resistance protein
VLLSLVAEPLTGVADTAFVARLGAAPLAGLGVAAVLASSVLWIFNFLGIGTQTQVARALGIGTQTQVARALGTGDRAGARDASGLALALAVGIGVGLALVSWPLIDPVAKFMSDEPAVRSASVVYLEIRLLGAPATLIVMVAFGAFRGMQDMRTPLWIAAASNAANVALDPVLIFGLGPAPALGVAGAAWATTASQWAAAVWSLVAIQRRLGLPSQIHPRAAGALLVVGRDLFLRTGSLLLFLVLATRVATRIGSDAGAAHQAIRQTWLLTALVLDAYAATAQSLVAWFLGAGRPQLARRVAAVACAWGLGTGVALTLSMWAGTTAIAHLLVPVTARDVFTAAWIVCALAQPLNALSFVTDGIHWGTGDYRFLRNAMIGATAAGAAILLLAVDRSEPGALTLVWLVTAGWIAVRAVFGIARIWPGIGASPLRAID